MKCCLSLNSALKACASIYKATNIGDNEIMILLKNILLGLLAMCFFSMGLADTEQPIYKVQLIVFAHVTPAALNSEMWPADPSLPSLRRIMNLKTVPAANDTDDQPAAAITAAAATPVPYQIIPFGQIGFEKVVKKLKAAKDYPPLVHVAWLEPGLPVRNSPRIHIYGGQAFASDGSPVDVTSPLLELAQPDAPDHDDETTLPVPAAQPDLSAVADWQLNGYVRVSKPYLFQIDTDLVLTVPRKTLKKLVPSIADNIKSNQFVMKQTFRLKLGELYYIDHPLFGVLVEVNKYTKKS